LASFIGYSQVPPICPYFDDSFSGQGPIVWMMRSSGLGTFQTSLTPSSQTCGSRSSDSLDRRAGEVTPAALGQDRRLGDDVGPGLEVAERLAVLAAALVPRAHAAHPAVLDQQLRGRGLREDVRAALLGLLLLIAGQRGHRHDLVAVVLERRRRRDPQGALLARKHVHRFLDDLAVREAQPAPVLARQLREELLQGLGAHDGAGQVVPAARLGLLDDRYGDLPERLHQLRVVPEELEQAVRRGQAGGAAADDRHADLDDLVLRVDLALDELAARVDRRRVVERREAASAIAV
jgi:hypothetical protein